MAWTVASGRDDETAAGQHGSPAGCPLHLAPVVLRGPPPPALRSQECPPPREDAPFTSAWRSAEASDSPVSSGLMLRVPPSLPEAVFRSCAPQPAAGEQPAAGAAEGASAGAAAHPEPHGSAAGCWREARRVSDADGELSADDYTSEALPRHGTFSHGEGVVAAVATFAQASAWLCRRGGSTRGAAIASLRCRRAARALRAAVAAACLADAAPSCWAPGAASSGAGPADSTLGPGPGAGSAGSAGGQGGGGAQPRASLSTHAKYVPGKARAAFEEADDAPPAPPAAAAMKRAMRAIRHPGLATCRDRAVAAAACLAAIVKGASAMLQRTAGAVGPRASAYGACAQSGDDADRAAGDVDLGGGGAASERAWKRGREVAGGGTLGRRPAVPPPQEIGPLDCTAVLSVMLTGAVASAAFDAVLELEDALAEARGIAEGRRSSTRRPKVLGSASEGMLSDIDDGAGSALEGGRWPREDEVEDGYFDDGLSDGESDDSDEESARDGDPEAEALAAKGEPGHRRPGKYVPTALRMSASRSSRGRSRPEPGLEQVVVRVGGGTVTRFGWAQLVSDAAAASLLRLAGLTAAAVSAARQARPDDDQPLPHAGAAGGPRDGSGYPSHALGADSVWHSASEATTRSDPWAAEIAASEAAALPLLAAAERIASAGPIGAGTRHSRWTCVVREAALAASTACAALGLERAARYGARGSTTAPSTAASERDVAAVLSALTPQTHCCQGCPPVGCAPATGLAPTAPGSVTTPSVLASVAAGLRPPPPGAHCPLTAGRRLQLQEQDARTRRLATGTGSVGTGTGTGTGGGAGAGAGAVDSRAPPLAGPPSVRSRPFDYQQQPASWSGVPYSSSGEGADRGPKRHRVDAEEFLGPAATVPTPSAKPVSRSTPMRSTEADLGAADILLTVAGGSAISGDDKRSDRMRAPPGPASIVSSLQDGGSGGEPDGFAQQNPLMPPRLEGGPDARHGYRAGLPSDRGAGSPELGVYTRQGFGTHAPPATSQGLPRVNSGLAVSMLSLSSAQQSTSQQRQVPSSASAMMVGPGGVMPSGSSGRYGDAMGLPNASSLSVLSGVYTSSQHPGLYIPGLFAGRGAASDLQDAAAQPTMAMGAATVLSGMSKGASQGHGGPRAGRGPSAASPMLSRPGSVGSSDRGNPLPSRGPAYPRPQGLARQLDEGDGGITIAEAFAGHMTDAERRAAYFEATTGAAHSEQQPGARDSQGSRRLPATRRVPPGRPGSSHYSMFGV